MGLSRIPEVTEQEAAPKNTQSPEDLATQAQKQKVKAGADDFEEKLETPSGFTSIGLEDLQALFPTAEVKGNIVELFGVKINLGDYNLGPIRRVSRSGGYINLGDGKNWVSIDLGGNKPTVFSDK